METRCNFYSLNITYWLGSLFLFASLFFLKPAWALDFTCSSDGGTNCPSIEFDNVIIGSKITVPAGVCPGGIADVNVQTDIATTWAADVDIFIFHSGNQAILVADQCEGNNNINATFDDEGSALVCGANPAINGSVLPKEPLSIFDDMSPVGDWTLYISDDTSDDLTRLVNWTLSIQCKSQLSITKTLNGGEPNTIGIFTITVSPPNNTGVSIDARLTYSGTATKDIDYIATNNVSIPNGASIVAIPFQIIDDTLVEGTETVTATLSLGATSSLQIKTPRLASIGTDSATADLTDNDAYTLSITKTTDGAEPSTNGQFTVTVSPTNTSGTPITGTVVYTGTATSGTDYTAPPY